MSNTPISNSILLNLRIAAYTIRPTKAKVILNPSRFEEMLSGKGTSSLSNTDKMIAITIDPAVAEDASKALCLSPDFSASIIIMNDEMTA